MKKRRLIIISFLVLIIGLGTSCNYDTYEDPEIDYTSTYPINGEYWVQYLLDDGSGNLVDVYNGGHTILTITNDARNQGDSLVIYDNKNFWQFKVKAAVDMKTKTWSVTDGYDYIWNDATTIANGKFLEGEGLSRDGNVTDSIYMEITWASDPTETFICAGVRKTGFLEDEW